MKALSQKLQGPPFQAPVNMKRLDPECGGCTDLATALTGGQHLFFYKKPDSLQHLSHSSHSGSTPLAQQRGLVPRPLAIVYTSGDNCTIQHRQLSGRCCLSPFLSGQERRESDQFYSSRGNQGRKYFLSEIPYSYLSWTCLSPLQEHPDLYYYQNFLFQ